MSKKLKNGMKILVDQAVLELLIKTKINKCRRFIVHYASLTCNSMRPQHTLQSHTISLVLSLGLNHYLDSLGSKGLLQPTFGATLARAICTAIEYVIFRTLSSGFDSNTDDQYRKMKKFIVRNLTNWANENHKNNILHVLITNSHKLLAWRTEILLLFLSFPDNLLRARWPYHFSRKCW